MPRTDHHPPLSLMIGRTTVRFVWRHDRWAHEIVFTDGTRWQSLEGPEGGGGDPRWPASPVLVELSRLDAPPGPAMLGVGVAGRSHFSASVGPDPAHPDRPRFEIACRVTEPPGWLGSTYLGAAGIIRVVPDAQPGRPPTTVQWGYSLALPGALPLDGSRVDRPPPPGH